YGGEANVGHFIELLELGHDHLAHHHRLDLTLTGSPPPVLDAPQRRLDLLDADRALFQRAQQTGAQLVLVEGLTTAILLDDTWQHQLGRFEGSEALLTGQAFPTPAHLRAVGYQSGIDHFGVIGTAERTEHGDYSRLYRRA